jgi:hypothetical protein
MDSWKTSNRNRGVVPTFRLCASHTGFSCWPELMASPSCVAVVVTLASLESLQLHFA